MTTTAVETTSTGTGKRCSACGETKPADAFGRRSYGSLRSRCRACDSALAIERRREIETDETEVPIVRWPEIRPLNPDLAEAQADLAESVAWAASVGLRIPCKDGESRLWLDDDDEVQRKAAALCASCPLLASCRDFATRFPREAGVLGGLTERERRKRKRSTPGARNVPGAPARNMPGALHTTDTGASVA